MQLVEFIGEAEADVNGVFWDERKKHQKTIWVWLKCCTHCQAVIKLGDGTTLHAYRFHHLLGPWKAQAKALKKAAGQFCLDDMFHSQASQQTILAKSAVLGQSALRFSADPGLRAAPPHEHAHTSPPTLADTPELLHTANTPSLAPEIQNLLIAGSLCPGASLDFPRPLFTSYPLHLHHLDNLDFSPIYWDNSVMVRLNTDRSVDHLDPNLQVLLRLGASPGPGRIQTLDNPDLDDLNLWVPGQPMDQAVK